MNSKQRKQKQRQALRMADKFVELVEQMLNEIEAGKTVDEARCDLAEVKLHIADCK